MGQLAAFAGYAYDQFSSVVYMAYVRCYFAMTFFWLIDDSIRISKQDLVSGQNTCSHYPRPVPVIPMQSSPT